MRALVLDQSTTTVGWAVVEEDPHREVSFGVFGRLLGHGRINTPPSHDLLSRLAVIKADLLELVNQFKPQEMVTENTTFITQRSGQTANAMAAIHMVCQEVAKTKQLATYSQNPSTIKKRLTGNGSATKEAIISQVKTVWGLPVVLDDNHADALGAAYVWLGRAEEVRHAKANRKPQKKAIAYPKGLPF